MIVHRRLAHHALALACLPACTLGVIPRDPPPPEPAPAAAPAEPAAPAAPATPATPATSAASAASSAPAAQPTAPATEPRAEYRLDGNRLELPGPIVFAAGQAQLDPASDPALEHARGYLAARQSVTLLRIEGHADDQALSERRAVEVGRWLVAHGVDCKRLLAVGFGATKPGADASTPEGKARNTRIELHNAALRGRPIGGASLEGGGQVASADLCQ